MANDKIYPIDMNPKDILLQNEGGGGMIMNDQFIGIVGNMLPDQKKLLDDQEHTSGTDIQTDKFSSNIIITNASSNPIGVNDLASKNFDSLDQSLSDKQISTPPPNNHCGGENLLNYEFQEVSKNFSLWEELNSNGGDNYLHFYDNNAYIKSEDKLKNLLFSTDIIDIIKKNITLDSANFKNLGWEKFGSGETNLIDNINFFYDKYFIKNERNDLGKIKDKNKLFKNNHTGKTEESSVFDIQKLPSGLRTMALQNCYNAGEKWINRILTTVGPDRMNAIDGSMGITIQQSSIGAKGSLSADEKMKKFYKEYEDILNVYTIDKTKFLQTLAIETKEWYGRLVDQGGDSRFKNQPKAFKDFYNVYVDMALSMALKYADCPNEYEVIGDVQPPSPLPPPPASTTLIPPPTKSEEEEGIYNAEFLPATEDAVQLYNNDDLDNENVFKKIALDPSRVVSVGNVNLDPSVKVDMKEIDTWVKMFDAVKADFKNGWTHPYHPEYGHISINPYLLQSIASACKKVNIVATITVSKTGHDINSKGGRESRHWKGTGVDIGILNGIKGSGGTNINNMVPEFRRLGTILYNQLVADGHHGNASQLGTNNQAEYGYDKSVLFMTEIGGNHYNHLHVGNRILSAPDVKPKVIRE